MVVVQNITKRYFQHSSKGFLLSETEVNRLRGKIEKLNTFHPSLLHHSIHNKHEQQLFPLFFGDQKIGFLGVRMRDVLTTDFSFLYHRKTLPDGSLGVCFSDDFVRERDITRRTEIVHRVNQAIRDNKSSAVKVTGWYGEMLPMICEGYGEEPLFLLERAMYPWFGAKAFGVHVNGYVPGTGKDSLSVTHMFIARRAWTKSTFPGMLDHIVAGGQPYGVSLHENVIKECAEEASIPEDLASSAISVGAVGYFHWDEVRQWLKRDVLYCFDLQLSSDFRPIPSDGEVEEFMIKEVDWVLDRLISDRNDVDDEFKPNCIHVILDFYFR